MKEISDMDEETKRYWMARAEGCLSNAEMRVFKMLVQGLTVGSITTRLRKTTKAVYTTIYRIRAKLKESR